MRGRSWRSPDYDLVKLLMRGGKPVFLAVNKVEGEAMELAAENFRQLGIRDVYPDQRGACAGHWRFAGCDFGGDSGDRRRGQGQRSAGDRSEEEAEEDEVFEGGPLDAGSREKMRRASRPIGRMGSLSSTRRRWRLSGGRMWASRRC